MKRKGFDKDNELMWEAFIGNSPDMDMGEEGMDFGSDEMGMDDDSAVVMEFEPMDEIEPVEDDTEIDIAVYSDIKKLAEYSGRILKLCKEQELEPWMLAQLVKASSYVSDVWHQLDAKADFANLGFEHSDNMEL